MAMTSRLAKATPRDRVELTDALADRVDVADGSLTPAQEAELARRMATFDADAKRAKPWAVMKAERNARAK